MNTNFSEGDFPDLFDVNLGILDMPGYIIFYVIIYGCSAVIGSFGNLLIILITLYSRKLHNMRNAFIINLSIADFLVSVITMPASMIGILFGKRWYEEKPALCLFTSMICAPICVVSLHSIAWGAISRYYYIAKFPLYNIYFSKNRIIMYIAFIWLLGCLVHLPNHIGWGTVHYSFMLRYCTLDTDEYSYAMFYAGALLSAITVSFVFYLKIYLVIRKSKLSKSLIIGSRKYKGCQNELRKEKKHINDEIKILKATFKIFILFVVCWLPAAILLFTSPGDKIPLWIYLYAGMLSHINSTMNFLVYFFGNKIFQNAVGETLSRILRNNSNRRRQSHIMSELISNRRKSQRTSVESP